jgi:type I site-specific restriction-modification system R (restriction) subunit
VTLLLFIQQSFIAYTQGFSMKPLQFAMVLLLGLAFSFPVAAEMYKYIDENGQTLWTDDLSQVPVEQREKVERYQSVGNVPNAQQSDLPQTGTTRNDKNQNDSIEISRAALEKEKADLDSQYQSLTKERQELEKWKTEAKDAEDREELSRRIEEYNKKAEQYEKQLIQFNEKLNTYNQKVLPKPSNDN